MGCIKVRFIFLWIVLLSVLFVSCGTKTKYPSGKDTVESFGDGTFQIIGRNPSGLYFEGGGSPLVSSVDNWCRINNKVYIFGHKRHNEADLIYGIINVKQNSIEIYFTETPNLSDRFLSSESIIIVESLSDFSETDQEILIEMEKSKRQTN